MSHDPTDPFHDELAKLWQEQETPMQYSTTPQELAKLTESIRTGYKTKKRLTVWLNFQEVVPALGLTAFFVWLAVSESDWTLFLGALLCLGVGAFLLVSSIRQHKVEQQFDSSITGSVEKSLSQARWALWMYRNVGWWYIAPLFVSVIILYISAIRLDEGFKPSDIAMWVLMVAVFGGVYLWNQRIASKKHEPEVARLEELLSDLKQ